MRCYVITELESDAALLKAVLAPDWSGGSGEIRIMDSGVRSRAVSMARTALAAQGQPVALVLNADTTNDRRIIEERAYLQESLHVGSPGIPWRVFLAVPELEICLFHDSKLIEELFGSPLSEVEAMQARFQPREVLTQLFARKGWIYSAETLSQLLAGRDLAQVRQFPLILELREFIQEVMHQPVQGIFRSSATKGEH